MIGTQAKVFGRIAAIGGIRGVDVAPLLDQLTVLAPELEQFARITMPHTFDRIAVTTTASRAAVDRIADLLGADQLARVQRLVGAETQELSVELETGPTLTTSIHAFGKRSIADDLQRLESVGMSAATCARVQPALAALADDTHYSGLSDRSTDPVSWRFHVAQRNRDAQERDATRARVLAAAIDRGVTEAQRNAFTGLHDALARTHNTYALLRATPVELEPELAVAWQSVPWELVVRMMVGFFPDADTGARLGELAGAAGTESASIVELVLRTAEPPAMRVSVIPA